MLVSAVITTYNRPQLVRRAIRSALNQTWDSQQIIVVEDGSNGGVEQWLTSEGLLERIQYERHETNRGLAAARNTGLELADGEYVAFLDDDDEWKPDFLMTLAGAMNHEEDGTAVAYCGIEVRDSQTNEVLSMLYPRNRGNLRDAIVAVGAATLPSSHLFSKSALIDVGGFDERLPSSIDHDIWMSLAAHGYAAAAVNEPLVVSYSSTQGKLTTDMRTRPVSVRIYLDKWMPSYQEWLGQKAGRKYAARYFAGVIGRLAADKLTHGQLAEAWYGIRQVFAYSGLRISIPSLAWYVTIAFGRRTVPPGVVRFLKRS